VDEGFTIHDDRSRCAHAGVCTDNLSEVFKLGVEPRVDPDGSQADEIARVVSLCPSGALSYSLPDSPEPVEHPEGPSPWRRMRPTQYAWCAGGSGRWRGVRRS
jgi:uncharacterized Fe-S cluster protein YjdI